MIEDVALNCLLDVNLIMYRFDMPHFLTGGTLLGAVRDKNFISWDKDIDLGFFARHYTDLKPWYLILKQLEYLGFNITKFNEYVITLDRGCRVDLFPFYEDGKDFFVKWGVGKLVFPATSLNELTTIEFKGHTFPIPQYSGNFLKAQYGDWSVPKKDFETVRDSFNFVEKR